MTSLTEAALFARIETLLELESYSDVVISLRRHPELVTSSFRLAWSLGWSQFQLENYHSARATLTLARDLAAPNDSAAFWALALAQEALGDLEQAEANLREALRREDTTIARQTLAVILMERGNLDDAERIHKEGLHLQPQSAERWEAYADFLLDCGRDADARHAQNEADRLAQEDAV